MLRTAAGRGPAIRVPSKLPTEPRQQLPAFPVERISDPDVMPILIAWVSSANTSCQTPNSIIGGIHTPASTHFRHGDITDQGGIVPVRLLPPPALVRASLILFLSEHFGREGFDQRSMFPRIRRQTRFAAGLFEEGDAVPVAFGGHLGQEETAVSAQADQQSMATDFHLIGGDWLRRRQDTQFNLQLTRLFDRHRGKTRVLERGGTGRIKDSAIHRTDGQDIADAPAQLSPEIERCESAARFGEVCTGRVRANPAIFQGGDYRIVG